MSPQNRFRRLIPTREQLAQGRFTRWLAPWLGQRKLWHWSRRGVALGVAIGIFFGLLIPVAQIPLSAAAAIALRANIPAAMGSTLVSNPVTFAPIYYLAWRTGARLTGHQGQPPPAALTPPHSSAPGDATAHEANAPASAWQRVQALGKPLIVGLGLFAIAGGLLAYATVSVLWWLHVRLKRRKRRAH
ncbi:DUF2062 domain-containing protein [Comamonadaceae bacterium OH2545_COT-014]|nr:DUF2062 domain-containing protein [Comamonadaceae bacterium OH2545_COT-014]